MVLTEDEINILKNKHRSDISALNAIVKLIGSNASSLSDPLYTLEKQGQSTITNISSGNTGSITAGTKETLIMNTGSSNILIDGEVVTAGLSFAWEGSFTYDSQSSSILIITTV